MRRSRKLCCLNERKCKKKNAGPSERNLKIGGRKSALFTMVTTLWQTEYPLPARIKFGHCIFSRNKTGLHFFYEKYNRSYFYFTARHFFFGVFFLVRNPCFSGKGKPCSMSTIFLGLCLYVFNPLGASFFYEKKEWIVARSSGQKRW